MSTLKLVECSGTEFWSPRFLINIKACSISMLYLIPEGHKMVKAYWQRGPSIKVSLNHLNLSNKSLKYMHFTLYVCKCTGLNQCFPWRASYYILQGEKWGSVLASYKWREISVYLLTWSRFPGGHWVIFPHHLNSVAEGQVPWRTSD